MPVQTRNVRQRTSLQLLVGACVLIGILVLVWFFVVASAWGHGFDNDAYFGRVLVAREVLVADNVALRLLTPASMIACLLFVCVVAWIRRIFGVGLIACAGVACAWVGAELLKLLLPWQALVTSDQALPVNLKAETFPSGHTTAVTALALAVVVVLPSQWRAWAAVAAGLVAAGVATGVLFVGWHRPSDALGGLCWAGAVMAVAAAIAVGLRLVETSPRPDSAGDSEARGPKRMPLAGAVIAAVFVFVAAWLAARSGSPGLPDADAAYVIATACIICAAFAITFWFGLVLSKVEWFGARKTESGPTT